MKYRVLVADPGWLLKDKLPGPGRGAEKHYECMKLKAIQDFPIPEMESPSILFLWRLATMVPEAYSVVKAWGFQHKTEIVWDKLTKTGRPWFGLGSYVRASHESCIVAVKGKKAASLRLSKSVRSRFAAPVPGHKHSAKPPEFYQLVESLFPGPYCELFARSSRPGWDCYGKELK